MLFNNKNMTLAAFTKELKRSGKNFSAEAMRVLWVACKKDEAQWQTVTTFNSASYKVFTEYRHADCAEMRLMRAIPNLTKDGLRNCVKTRLSSTTLVYMVKRDSPSKRARDGAKNLRRYAENDLAKKADARIDRIALIKRANDCEKIWGYDSVFAMAARRALCGAWKRNAAGKIVGCKVARNAAGGIITPK